MMSRDRVAGDLGDRFPAGWSPVIDVTVDGPNKRVGFQFEYACRGGPRSQQGPRPAPLVVRIRLSARRFLKAFTPSRPALVDVA